MAWARMLRWGTRIGVVLAVALPVAALFGWASLAALYEMFLLACLAARWAGAKPRPALRRAFAAVAAAMVVVGVFVAGQVPLARHDSLYAANVLIGVSLEVVLVLGLVYGGTAYLLKRSLG
jgi:hypothetical protein